MMVGRLSLAELVSLPTFYMPSVSPDRTKLAFYADTTGAVELYVVDLATPDATPEPLTRGHLPQAIKQPFVWSKDSRKIYFGRDHEGDERYNLWRIDILSRKTEPLTTQGVHQFILEVHPNNRTLLVNSAMHKTMNLFAFDGKRKTYKPLTQSPYPIWYAKYSPTGNRIVYTVNGENIRKNLDVYIMSEDGSGQKLLIQVEKGSLEHFSDWSDDGRYLAISSDAGGFTQTGVYDFETETLRFFTPKGINYVPGRFSPNGRYLTVYRNADAAVEIEIYDIRTGQPLAARLGEGMTYNTDWVDDNRFVVNIMTDVRRNELWLFDHTTGEKQIILPAAYGSIDPAHFAPHEYVHYPSTDGTSIPALLYRPPNVSPQEKLPALVMLHGGPASQFFRGFDPFTQFLVSVGFVIIQPNVRGSTGYGTAFRDACLLDWGGKDLEDVEGAAQYLRSLPTVDPSRIGVLGSSYGGYLAYLALTKKPNVFQAGAAWVGMTDLPALFETTLEQFRFILREQMGEPQNNLALWKERSPLYFAEQLQAPLLILHGVNDPRIPIEQARAFREALLKADKAEGQDFEYLELTAEGHGSTDIEQRIRAFEASAAFMTKRLGK